MRVVIQRVLEAQVEINQSLKAKIAKGLLVLVGFGHDDDLEDIQWISHKLLNLRIFADDSGKLNCSVQDIQGDILVVSQFTLYASTKKGNRPSFIHSAEAKKAKVLYDEFIQFLDGEIGIKTGEFGADMKVSLTNDGPITICIDSKNKF